MDDKIAALIEQGKIQTEAAHVAAKEKEDQETQKREQKEQAQREEWIAAMLPDIPAVLHPYIIHNDQVCESACKMEVPECETIWYNTQHRKPFSIYVNRESFYFDTDQIARCVAFAHESWEIDEQRRQEYEAREATENAQDKAEYEQYQQAQAAAAQTKTLYDKRTSEELEAAHMLLLDGNPTADKIAIAQALALVVIATSMSVNQSES